MNENPTTAEEQYELGKKYKEGKEVPYNSQKWEYWYTKAAEQGHADAQFELGNYAKNADYWWPKAAEQFSKAANKGDADAMCKLSIIYECSSPGSGLYDIAKARDLLFKAADLGHSKAMYKTGFVFQYGLRDWGGHDYVKKNIKHANEWFELAAKQSHADAQYKLGVNYANGKGVPKDLEKAKHWIFLAAEQGNEDAKNALDRLNAGKSLGGCYVATYVYGSYDCPEVWTLRRFRDNILSNSRFGRWFIRIYYAVSPKIVELFGNNKWFSRLWKPIINKIVCKLQNNGIDSSPYSDAIQTIKEKHL